MCGLGYWLGNLLYFDSLPGPGSAPRCPHVQIKYWRIGWIRIDNFPTRPDIPCHHDTWHHDSLVTNYYWKLRSDPRVLVLGTWSCRVSDICTEMSFSFIWNIQNLHIWSKKFRDYREFWDAGRVLVTVYVVTCQWMFVPRCENQLKTQRTICLWMFSNCKLLIVCF